MGNLDHIKTSNSLWYIPIVLSIAAGALMIVGGITVIVMFGWYHSMSGGMFVMMNSMMHQGTVLWPFSMTIPTSYFLGILIMLSLLSLVPGIVSIVGGYKMYKKPENRQNWAIAVLIASMFGFFTIPLITIPAILGIIAGITAIVISARRYA